MRKLFLFATTIGMLSSCAPMVQEMQTHQVAVQETILDYSESSAHLLDASNNFLVLPIIANLEVSNKKIIHVEKDAFAEVKVNRSTIANIAEYKRTAIGRAALAYNADVIVNTDVDVKTEDGRFVITVTGYPANYKNFRNATTKDIGLVKAANEAQVSVFTTVDDTVKVEVNK